MKILVVSNLYPPHHQGGYELRCQQVTEYLLAQGHDVRVVASSYDLSGGTHGAKVRDEVVNGVPVARFFRQHRLDSRPQEGRLYYLDVVRRQVQDITRFAEILDEFTPNLVSWWNLEGLTKAILRMPQDRGIPCTYCIDDNWMIREFGAAGDVDLPLWINFWRVNWGPKPLRPAVRLALAPMERRLEQQGIPTRQFTIPSGHVCFISEFWRHLHRQAGLDVSASDVIYGGVAPERFYTKRTPQDYGRGPLRLLYAGFIDERRGLLTIVEALGLLEPEQRARMHLSVAHAGPITPDEYVNRITSRIAELGLGKQITFLGRVPHDEMPAVYAAHDVLVFASTRNEGMPMVMMEAMCAGCAVPNTGSGGSIELSDRARTPIFPKDHPFALSRLLRALEQDRGWVADVALRGQQTVLRDFTISRMLEKTADVFVRAAARPSHELQSLRA
jgi:glycosyltransferase involved in cell wall biosynthesis